MTKPTRMTHEIMNSFIMNNKLEIGFLITLINTI